VRSPPPPPLTRIRPKPQRLAVKVRRQVVSAVMGSLQPWASSLVQSSPLPDCTISPKLEITARAQLRAALDPRRERAVG
jgi:hypothetical protein